VTNMFAAAKKELGKNYETTKTKNKKITRNDDSTNGSSEAKSFRRKSSGRRNEGGTIKNQKKLEKYISKKGPRGDL